GGERLVQNGAEASPKEKGPARFLTSRGRFSIDGGNFAGLRVVHPAALLLKADEVRFQDNLQRLAAIDRLRGDLLIANEIGQRLFELAGIRLYAGENIIDGRDGRRILAQQPGGEEEEYSDCSHGNRV